MKKDARRIECLNSSSVLGSIGMSSALYKYINGHMGKEEFKDYAVKRSTTSAGSLTGGVGGSIAGVAAGAAIG